jgi:hypothetical protein
MRIFSVLVLLLFATASRAEWTAIGKTDLMVSYVDLSTIKRDGRIASVKEMLTWNKAMSDGERSQTVMVEYDCTARKSRIRSIQSHTEPMGKGRALGSSNNPGPWNPVARGTVADHVANKICQSFEWKKGESDDDRVEYYWAQNFAKKQHAAAEHELWMTEIWKTKKPEISKDQKGVEYQVHALSLVRSYSCTDFRYQTRKSWVVLGPEVFTDGERRTEVTFREGNPHRSGRPKEGSHLAKLIGDLCRRLPGP